MILRLTKRPFRIENQRASRLAGPLHFPRFDDCLLQ